MSGLLKGPIVVILKIEKKIKIEKIPLSSHKWLLICVPLWVM